MTIMTLWLPILVAAVVVFIAGAVIWMAMPWHKTDWSKTADEEAVRAALKSTSPGMYTVPNVNDRAEFADPDCNNARSARDQYRTRRIPIVIARRMRLPYC